MTNPLRLPASKTLLRLFCLVSMLPLAAAAGAPVAWDLGLRAAIYDENYKAGVGGELGAILSASDGWDLGLHLNYTHFAAKTEHWDSVDEMGGYIGAYYKPKIDQAFWLRIGPHIGYAKVYDHYVDIGGDVMAVFKATPTLDIYGAFIPAFFAGKDGQTLIRVGFGIEYHAPN